MVRYLETFYRHRLLLLLPMVLSMAVAAAIVVQQPGTYTATARLWFDYPLYGPLASGSDSYTPPSSDQSSTLTELLKTRAFPLRAGDRGPLPDYLARPAPKTLASWLPAWTGFSAPAPPTGPALDDAVVASITGGTHVSTGGPHVLVVSFKSTDAEVAAEALQAIIAEFSDEELGGNRSKAQAAVDFYGGQLDSASRDLQAAEAAVSDYVASHPAQQSLTPPPDTALDNLRFRAEVARQRYLGLRTKVQQLQLEVDAVRSPTDLGMRVLDQPVAPSHHDSRAKLLAEALGGALVCGLVLTLLALLLLTTVDTSIRRADEVEALLKLQVVGAVPASRRGAA